MGEDGRSLRMQGFDRGREGGDRTAGQMEKLRVASVAPRL
jgi:hypothetical protein